MLKTLVLSCLATAVTASAQYPPPAAYTIVQQNSLFGPDTTTTVYRDGSKAVMDIVHPGTHVRSVLDLQAHTSISWDASQAAAECGNSTFKGDWGHPFVGAATFMDEINKQHPTPVGTETVNGMSAKVSEFTMEGATAKSKVWIEPKYGMIVRMLMAPPSGAPKVVFETVKMTFAAPPPRCSFPRARPPRPSLRTRTRSLL